MLTDYQLSLGQREEAKKTLAKLSPGEAPALDQSRVDALRADIARRSAAGGAPPES